MPSIIELLEKNRVKQEVYKRKIGDIIKDIEDQKIIIPDYQRNFVWDPKTQSKFIESIFLNIPIPPIFFSEKIDNLEENVKHEVIDGSQRLKTLYKFDANKLRLRGLEKLSAEFENKTKNDLLPAVYSKYFQDRLIQVIVIDKDTNSEIQYDIFERLNQGSISLNQQELRNCIFHSEFNEYLMKLRENKTYIELMYQFSKYKYIEISKVMDSSNKEMFKRDNNRLSDVEMILRFLVLYETYLVDGKFRPPKKELLNNYMSFKSNKKENNIYTKSMADLETTFERSLKIVQEVFNNNHFKRYFLKEKNLEWLKNLNKAIFDLQMLGLLNYSDDFINENKESIYFEFVGLCISDSNFIRTILANTDQQIDVRMNIWFDRIDKIFNDPDHYRNRLNDIKFKMLNEKCFECNDSVSTIEEADLFEDQCLIHKVCKLKYIQEKNEKNNNINNAILDYEQKILNAIARGGNLPRLIYDFLIESRQISYIDIEKYIKENEYQPGAQINQILGVIVKFYPVKTIGAGRNKLFEWSGEEE